MKKTLKKALSVVLALVMLMSVCSVAFSAFAEEGEGVATPGIQTLLRDGAALKEYLETNFLSLEKADALLVENLPDLCTAVCGMAGELFYQMGYNEAQYPADEDSLLLALARILGSLGTETFREPEKVETTDMSLVYNLAYLGGTQYIETINAALPEALRFDTSVPVLKLDAAQKEAVLEYYHRWQEGAIHLDDFDIKDYLGDMTPEQYLKTVVLVFIADDNRLPAITEAAINYTLDTARKAAIATAFASILDNLNTAPVSAIVRAFSNPAFTAVLKELLAVADKVTLATDCYAYHLYQEGIYTDTDGSAIRYITANGDGTYSYAGPSLVSDYLPAIYALLDLLEGSYDSLNTSVLQTLLFTKLEDFKAFVGAALEALIATVTSARAKVENDLVCAEIEERFAAKQLADIHSGAYVQALISAAQSDLDAVADEIAALQAELKQLQMAEAVAKQNVQNYYDVLAQFEAVLTEDNRAEMEADPEYIAAKAMVEKTEASLADNYARQAELTALIAEKSNKADELANEIYRLQHDDIPADASSVWNKVLTAARDKQSDCRTKLADMPDSSLIDNLMESLPDLVAALLGSLDGVYDTMMKQSPIQALIALVLGLEGFVGAVEAVDWDAFADGFAQMDAYIDAAAGKYLASGGGENMLADLSEMLGGILDTYGVYDYINVSYLNNFIANEILGDNSETMQMAAGALSEMFAGVQPTYESIVSCLIPILSAFDFGAIMSNIDNIGASLSLASPSAFAYLAGLSGSGLQSGYLSEINANLASYGYTGTPVGKILTLSSTKQSALLRYVQMEQSGTDLATIAASGFNWTNYTDGATNLQIANAFIKIALGDNAKLGDIAAAPGLGTALVNLLCDLLDDLKSAPVDTLLKKISNAADLSAIADFAMGLLNGFDTTMMSYDLFFTQNIFYDAEGNTTFYDYINTEGNADYKGPRVMDYYVPIIAAAIDFLSGLYTDVNRNGGDLLKTMLFDKIPQMKNLIKSLIAYENEQGEEQAGMLFYLLMGYGDYLKSENAVLSYELLISLAEAAKEEQRGKMQSAEAEIALWEGYLAQLNGNVDAAKLAKARELGVIDASVTAYDEQAMVQAIAAKAALLETEIAALEEQKADLEAARDAAETAYNEAAAASEAFTASTEALFDGAIYDYLCTIMDEQDVNVFDSFRFDCAADFEENFGEGTFEAMLSLIEEYMEIYEGDADSFIYDIILGEDGLNLSGTADALDAAATEKQNELADAEDAVQAKQTEIETKGSEKFALESGAVFEQIQNAAGGATIHISNAAINAEGDFTAADIEDAINTIRTENLTGYQSAIDEQEALIAEYTAKKAQVASDDHLFNAALVPLAAAASDVLAQGVINILTGDAADGSENVYYYIMNRNITDILTTGGRLQALFEMIVGIYEPALRALVTEGLLDSETAEQLIEATPSFDTFYAGALARFPEAFKQNPVGAAGDLLAALCETVLGGFAALDEDLTHDALQIKKINKDITDIFDEDFAGDWSASYSKAIAQRIGPIYRLIADILGLSFLRQAAGDEIGTTGTLTGKIDTSKLFADAVVYLYAKDRLVAQAEVSKDSDGTFTFNDVEEGSYVIKLSTNASVPFEIDAIDVIADATTDLADHRGKDLEMISIPVGDTSGNGSVGIEDVAIILLAENYGTGNTPACDVNCDGVADIGDVTVILAEGNFTAAAKAVQF